MHRSCGSYSIRVVFFARRPRRGTVEQTRIAASRSALFRGRLDEAVVDQEMVFPN